MSFQPGGTPDTANEDFWADRGDGVPWVAIGDMSGTSLVTDTAKSLTAAGLADRGLAPAPSKTVLLAMYASVGAVSTLGINAVWNQAILGLTPIVGQADSRFVAYWLRHYSPMARAEARSATQANLNADQVANFPFPSIGVDDQRRIADFLDDRVTRIDQIIAARHSQLKLLDGLLIARMRAAVAGVLESTEGRQAAEVPWVERVADEALVLPLARVVTLQRGVDLTDAQRRHGTVQVVTTAGVVGTHDTAIETGPGVVIGRYGSVGNVHWVDGPYWPHNTTLYVKNTHGNELRWIYYLLHTFPYGAMQARAAIPGVNRNDMATELVPWIPPDQQRASVSCLDERVEADNHRRAELERTIQLLGEYKQSLIAAAVTGELDVSTAGSGISG